jgi:hypothetical protein
MTTDYKFDEVFPLINEIIIDLGILNKDLSVDDVCQLFSICHSSFNKKFESFMEADMRQLKIEFPV